MSLSRSVLNLGLDRKVKTGGAIENTFGPPTLAKEPGLLVKQNHAQVRNIYFSGPRLTTGAFVLLHPLCRFGCHLFNCFESRVNRLALRFRVVLRGGGHVGMPKMTGSVQRVVAGIRHQR